VKRKPKNTTPPHTPRPPSNKLSDAPSASNPPPNESNRQVEALASMVRLSDLSVVFQPIVDVRNGKVFAHEALVRCQVEELRNPLVLFERSVELGCTGQLGRMIREIGVPHGSGKPLFVNIHPTELSQEWLVRLDDPIFAHDHDVYLEVTESVPMTHFELCTSVLREVSSRGAVDLVVDDFGAGYSNILRIADLEPSVVKLDRSLVAELDTKPRRRELVSAVVDMCVRLGAKVVAEGVETKGELEAVRDAGAHFAQGFLLARPAFPPPEVSWPLESEGAQQQATIPPRTLPSAD
jgi:EAL domain-containing protein (putative c-di-GMP-specific phosphodiesterase class I)